MKRSYLMFSILFGIFYNAAVQAHICPDPETSSLSCGEIPAPWQENPFSPNSPQGEEGTQFVRANILVTSGLGQGVTCTYKFSLGEYSIWWPVLTKLPSRNDVRWVDTVSGYICTQSLSACEFFVADDPWQ